MITAGAAGMYCGSCMHDNTLASALIAQGHDAILIPTYTPVRTDEEDVTERRVFFGGINVFLQERFWLFRHTPWLLDRLLDLRPLLRWVSRWAVHTRAEDLGGLTRSMLAGTHGHQSKEIDKLVGWLETEHKPEIITLTNVLLSGLVPTLKRRLGVPVVAWLQGDDIFLEALPARDRQAAIELIRRNCAEVDGYLVTSRYYADFMAEYLGLPRERMQVAYPGLNLKGHGQPEPVRTEPPYTIGYFARICPEKGLHLLTEAFRQLCQMPDAPPCRLRISGWLGENQRGYFADCLKPLRAAGLAERVEHVESPTHADKVRFLHTLDVLSVPTTYREPKGLYILEALANGVPVVQPRHGSFPELIEATGGGVLVEPNDPADLAQGLRMLLASPTKRAELAERGRAVVQSRFEAGAMAREVGALLEGYLPRKAP